MSTIKTKQKWIRTGRTFSAPLRMCEETKISKHEKEIISEIWEMTEEIDPTNSWERGTWATLERVVLRVPRKNDVVYVE